MRSKSFRMSKSDLSKLNNKLKKGCIAPFAPFIGPNALIRSIDWLKILVEAGYDLKQPIFLKPSYLS